MRKKLLTQRQQIGFFNCQDPIALMREYVSFTDAIMDAAELKLEAPEYKSYPVKKESRLYENQKEARKECFANLSLEDARFIKKNQGHIYPEVFMKMLEVFPKKVSKEVLVKYAREGATIHEDVLFRAVDVLGKGSREVIIAYGFISIRLFNKMLKIFSKEEIKYIIIETAMKDDGHFCLQMNVEMKIFKLLQPEEAKEMIKFLIRKTPGIDWETYPKLFDMLPMEDVKEILELSIEEDQDIFTDTLEKIVEVFPKDEAKALLDAFFETSPGSCEYTEQKIEQLYKKLNKKEN